MLAGMHDLLPAAVSHKDNVCRSYKNTMLRHVAEFLTAVKASLVKLGVDESRLQRITQEVGPHHGLPRTAVCSLPIKQMFVAICLLQTDVVLKHMQVGNKLASGYTCSPSTAELSVPLTFPAVLCAAESLLLLSMFKVPCPSSNIHVHVQDIQSCYLTTTQGSSHILGC